MVISRSALTKRASARDFASRPALTHTIRYVYHTDYSVCCASCANQAQISKVEEQEQPARVAVLVARCRARGIRSEVPITQGGDAS